MYIDLQLNLQSAQEVRLAISENFKKLIFLDFELLEDVNKREFKFPYVRWKSMQ